MEEMSRFNNEVRQDRQKHNKQEGSTKTKSYKSDKRHKSDKRQPLPKGPRYEHYASLMANRTIILKEAFNLEVPIKLPSRKLPKSGSDTAKFSRYHHDIGHNTDDCRALKDKM